MNHLRKEPISLEPVLLPQKGHGAVLVIVLAFIVLFAGLVVAFFSRAIVDRQISNNSANTTKVDIFARSAANTIIGDLKQEIAAGSGTLAAVSGSSTTIIYAPLASSGGNQTAVPYRMAPSATFANVVKQSAFNQSFYSGANYDTTNYPAPNRAADIPSTTASLNNRFISLSSWNKALLLPKANPTSATDPTPDSNFKAPDWILVERSGSNPKRGTPNVVGRYAYTVYDEGGLLDLNVAGYPGSAPSNHTDTKSALSFADLTKLGLTQAQVDTIVGWRNYSTLQPSGDFPNYAIPATSATNYYSAVQSLSFMRTGTAALYNGQSDRMFSGRQELLNFIQNIGDSTQRAALQNAMQYLGTFSRDLNQPSLVPANIIDPKAPKIVDGDGGNVGFGGDASINPAFLTVRAGAGVKRNDGSAAIPGEPLVKKRFALSRLAWITCKGPSANLSAADPVFTETVKALGWDTAKATAWLKQGTDAAILNYFGLDWDKTNKRWNYAAHRTGTHISTLAEVAAANREPDFVELLKASINTGALGKGATSYRKPSPLTGADYGSVSLEASWEDYQFRQDVMLNQHVLQIAANIIDQYDVDGFPTRIYFDDGSEIGTREIVGVENLPYFYRIRPGVVRAAPPVPYGYIGTQNTVPDPTLYYSGSGTPPNVTIKTGTITMTGTAENLTDTGLMVYMLQPELWNPHDQNNPRATSDLLVPTTFRFTADSTSPDLIGGPKPYPTISVCTRGPANYTPFGGGVRPNDTSSVIDNIIPFDSYPNYPMSLTSANSELDFNVSGASSYLFAEPTLLIRPGYPSGSNLKLGEQHNLRVFTSGTLKNKFVKLTTAVTSGSGEGIKSMQDNNTYIGLYITVGPVRWLAKCATSSTITITGTTASGGTTTTTTTSGTYTYVVTADNMGPASPRTWSVGWDSGITFRVQCQDPFGNWFTYDQKYSQESRNLQSVTCTKNGGKADWTNPIGLIGNGDWTSCIDPRTSRFGMQGGNGATNTNPLRPPGRPGGTPAALNISQGVTYSNRWDGGLGAYMLNNPSKIDSSWDSYGYGLPLASGWYPKNKGAPWSEAVPFYYGLFAQNSTGTSQYYSDADGVIRRASAAYTNGSLTGQPLAIATGSGANYTTSLQQSQSRPIILNRPFRSVAELGYVYSGTPWKNLDMFTPESGFNGLLDVFCINETDSPSGVVAGKVNLNTWQEPVLEAILAGAYQDEMTHYTTKPGWTLSALSGAAANTIATALINRTRDTDSKKGPMRNLADLVGRWTGAVAAPSGDIDGSKSYHGFSEDLTSANAASNNIPRMREAAMRALANCGTTRVWNLMIDVVAQTGRYPSDVTDPAKFIVDGQRRYWLHVAIDRYTGEVIDQNLEIVRE